MVNGCVIANGTPLKYATKVCKQPIWAEEH
jgi:hypothetical protein